MKMPTKKATMKRNQDQGDPGAASGIYAVIHDIVLIGNKRKMMINRR